MPKHILIALYTSLVLLVAPVHGDTGGAGLKPDLRLLIDISGSMKTSDPDNLRAPAMEMLVRLLPDGARAGVWLFGEDVKILVPHGEVNAQWRAQARDVIGLIDNSGQRTNIPAALAAATYDFERMDPGYRTSIVLLTDGKVDIAESPMRNASAAREILNERAPALGATGIPVHTIALSEEADWKFLRSLALATSGIAEQAATADALSGIFLQSLELVAPVARVPVAGQSFTIDASVEELTTLVFFSGRNQSIALISPSGRQYNPQGSGGDWFLSEQFALVTIPAPEPGAWRLEAPGAKQVRVTVISNLQIEVDPLPASIAAGRQAELGLRITEQGKAITDPAVLTAFELVVDILAPDGSREIIPVSARYEAPLDGEYRVSVPVFEQAGRYEFMVRLNAQTLQRELPLHVEVMPKPEQATLVTRGDELPEDEYTAPLAAVGAAVCAAGLLVWYILRRRKKRKLEIWERRAKQASGDGTGQFSMSGISAAKEEAGQPLD
ncbi:vWA domain-containing protein [Halioglobus maricola]|uniref:vWA domain-containing protein n=1 Tax=Halioglobus maricola TaxID=2601894 RepID=UPI0014783B45|nr:vWA domain-containing protein [Halioglobus maricola]